jgi:phospholipase/lecithinase/hemolysin
LLTQLALFPPPAALVPTSLFVVWGGANDFEIGGSPAVAAADIDFIVASLLSQGATHILVPGLPDLGKTPEFYGVAAATLYTQQFNQDLLAGLPLGATYFDTYAFLNGVIANPGAYGFTNVTGQCLNGATPCANPSQYLFWDDIHPTTATDALLARQFDATVTPEPSSFLLLGTGITGLATAILRKRRAA